MTIYGVALLSSRYMKKKGWLIQESEKGIWFWSSIFLPIVIAMSAIQNVNAALSGGSIAVLAGLGATIACLMLVPVISRIGKSPNSN